jgi:hypothetical protein
MRIQLVRKDEYMTREISFFALWPIRINRNTKHINNKDELRWMEYVTIEQECRNGKWTNTRFV